MESKKEIVGVLEENVDSDIKKDLQEEILSNMHQAYFVNPEEFQKYFNYNKYFRIMEQNINKEQIDLGQTSVFLGELILLCHGLKNSA